MVRLLTTSLMGRGALLPRQKDSIAPRMERGSCVHRYSTCMHATYSAGRWPTPGVWFMVQAEHQFNGEKGDSQTCVGVADRVVAAIAHPAAREHLGEPLHQHRPPVRRQPHRHLGVKQVIKCSPEWSLGSSSLSLSPKDSGRPRQVRCMRSAACSRESAGKQSRMQVK